VNAASGRVFPTINPCTGEKIIDVQEGDKVTVFVCLFCSVVYFVVLFCDLGISALVQEHSLDTLENT